MHLQESGEMYLETIYILSQSGKSVRSIDVCEEMGYSKPSVSRAVGLLKREDISPWMNWGTFTSPIPGWLSPKNLRAPHDAHRLFTYIGVSPETAAKDACRIEHCISDETFLAMQKHAAQKSSVKNDK